jgi:hypothetical protein
MYGWILVYANKALENIVQKTYKHYELMVFSFKFFFKLLPLDFLLAAFHYIHKPIFESQESVHIFCKISRQLSNASC